MGSQLSVHPSSLADLTEEQKAELIARGVLLPSGEIAPVPEASQAPDVPELPRPSRAKRGSGIVGPDGTVGLPQPQMATRKQSTASAGSGQSAPGGDAIPPQAAVPRGGPDRAPVAQIAAITSRSVPKPAPVAAEAAVERRPTATVGEAAPVAEKKARAPVAFAANIHAAQEALDAYCGIPGMYELLKPIGCGAYGAVYLARDPRTGTKVAVKHIINAFTSITDARRIFREIKVMKHFTHPNIVRLLHVVRPANTRSFEHIYLVSELMETDLHRVVHSRQDLTSDHISYFLYQASTTACSRNTRMTCLIL